MLYLNLILSLIICVSGLLIIYQDLSSLVRNIHLVVVRVELLSLVHWMYIKVVVSSQRQMVILLSLSNGWKLRNTGTLRDNVVITFNVSEIRWVIYEILVFKYLHIRSYLNILIDSLNWMLDSSGWLYIVLNWHIIVRIPEDVIHLSLVQVIWRYDSCFRLLYRQDVMTLRYSHNLVIHRLSIFKFLSILRGL